MTRRVISAVVAAAAITACTPASGAEAHVRPADLGEVLGISELVSLDSVSLGMGARALQSARPDVGLMPYLGMYEALDADTVYYHFPGGAPADVLDETRIDGRAAAGGAPLLAVELYTRYPSTAVADSVWASRAALLAHTDAVGRVKADSAVCFSYMNGTVPGLAMLLKVGEDWVGVVRYAEIQESDISGTWTRQAVVRSLLTRDPAIFIPEVLKRTIMPCPSHAR